MIVLKNAVVMMYTKFEGVIVAVIAMAYCLYPSNEVGIIENISENLWPS